MLIIPAIDIKNCKCVRLIQGDFAKEIIYDDDPVAVAIRWQSEGAKMLHVVDLDGAKKGKPVNMAIIKKMVKTVNIPLQVGGGIRDEQTVKELLTMGVDRIVLSTVIFENKALLKTLLRKYANKIAVALDSKNGKLVKKGWLENSSQNLIETARHLESLGTKKFIYTNVARDGTLTQPDYQEIEVLLKNIKTSIIVSGGISKLSDIKRLKDMKVAGVIIGKALYEGKINLKEAINAG